MPEIVLISVLLPAPLSPTSAVTWPTGTSRLMSVRARTGPKFLPTPTRRSSGWSPLLPAVAGASAKAASARPAAISASTAAVSAWAAAFSAWMAAASAGASPATPGRPAGAGLGGVRLLGLAGLRRLAGLRSRRPARGGGPGVVRARSWSPGAPPYVQPEAAHYDIPAVLHRATYWPTHSCATVTNLSAMTVEAMFAG